MKRFIAILIISIAINVEAAPLQEGLTDNTNPVLSYSGTWSEIESVDAYAYGGTFQQTTDVSATLTFETYAPGITIFFIYDPLGDDVEVCVDMDCLTVSTLGAASIGSMELSNFAYGLKNITVAKVTNDVSAFNFDAIYIHPYNESEANSEQLTTFELDGQTYTGVFVLRITSGEAMIVLLLSSLIALQLFSLISQLWRKPE
jgi:hypothetical protein